MTEFLATLIAAILNNLVNTVIADVKAQQAVKDQQAANQSASNASVKPLADATTGDQIDEATPSALGGL
jgi:hypothetical protein